MDMVMVMVMGKMTLKENIKKFLLYNRLYLEIYNRFFQTKALPFVNPVKIDLHSHLLPGIDDGVDTIEESIKIIKKFKSLGYTKLITTPHIISDSYPNTKEIIQSKLQEVQQAIKNENIDIEIEAGAEHYIDMSFLKDLEEDKVVPFANKYILFETSYVSKPIIFEQAIFDIQAKGYIPVLAHPERYRYMHENIEHYKKLKNIGVLFQMNIKSLRDISNPLYKVSLQLMKSGLIDFIGSDVHRMKDMIDLARIINEKPYQIIFNNNKILNMSYLQS
jgi:tyrosine-protein phosphatase YwqE